MTDDRERAPDADPFSEYRGLEFMESRIPIQDALAVFVPDDPPPDARIRAALSEHGQSRWFPRPGGHEVRVPYAGDAYDASIFRVVPGGWDHETCTHCRIHVPPMTLCWVTPSGWFVLLCEQCHDTFNRTATLGHA